jgi:hypothetical protein
LLGVLAVRIANLSFFGLGRCFLDKSVVDGFLDESSTAGATVLAVITENGVVGDLDGFVN